MRIFAAVNPPRQTCLELTTRLDSVRGRLPIAWTAGASWHLTLSFLGAWPPDRLPALKMALQEAVSVHPAFVIQPGQVGAFPDMRRPRVLFLHLDGGEPLRQLACSVRRAVDAVWPDGPQDRKALRPHLTLARIKQKLDDQQLALLRSIDLGRWEPFRVSEVLLLSSELRREGARHTPQAVMHLAHTIHDGPRADV
jgi:RNA 2',3'-cyclic 3'-phosphodiesterase